MRSLIARPLLRRIALGLPLAAWPLLALPGCGQECSPGPVMTSSHPLTDALRGRIVPGGTLDRSRCRPECLELDGVTATDAGSRADDAGPSSIDPSFALAAEVTCGVDETGTLLDCAYRGPAICRSVGCQFPGAVAGRAPSGLLAAHTHDDGTAAAWLAEVARLELAAIDAFAELEGDVLRHRAPSSFVARMRRARADEARHAERVGALARRHGAVVRRPIREATEPRTLVQLAIDNAVEGCVREAYGAVVAAAQAASASDPRVRATFSAIAREEAEHALLSLDLDAWAGSRLSPRDRRRVEAERDEATVRFATELEAEPTPGVRSLLGLPDATRAQDLLRAIA